MVTRDSRQPRGTKLVSYPNFVRGPLLDDMRPFFGPCEVLGTHH